MDVVRQIVRSENKTKLKLPQSEKPLRYFGNGELSDLLGFGFSYIEHEDHFVGYILVSPGMAKRLVKEIDSFNFTVETEYVGQLWTAQVLITDKVKDNIVFSNSDFSVVLDLYPNKIEEV